MACKLYLNKAVNFKKKVQGSLVMYSNLAPTLVWLFQTKVEQLRQNAAYRRCQEYQALATAHPLLSSSCILGYLRKFQFSELCLPILCPLLECSSPLTSACPTPPVLPATPTEAFPLEGSDGKDSSELLQPFFLDSFEGSPMFPHLIYV